MQPNSLKNDKIQSSLNIVPNSQTLASPNLTNAISSNQQEQVSASPPSFSNLSQAQNPARNSLDSSQR
jgi:hypothetical protein